jgi:hypothetical protein
MHVELSLRDLITPGEALKQKRLVVVESSPVCVYLMILLGFGLIPGFILIYVSPGFRAGEINYAFLRMLLPRKIMTTHLGSAGSPYRVFRADAPSLLHVCI